MCIYVDIYIYIYIYNVEYVCMYVDYTIHVHRLTTNSSLVSHGKPKKKSSTCTNNQKTQRPPSFVSIPKTHATHATTLHTSPAN